MKKLLTSIAALALITGFTAGVASAKDKPFAGVVLVAANQAPSIYDLDTDVVVSPASASPTQEASTPRFKRGKIVSFATQAKAGDIIINTKANRLYYVLGNGKAVQYRVATAKKGFEWRGTEKVSMKVEWPDWRPPVQMRERRPDLPEFMAGGPENPLGARAIYLGSSIYRIHGTNEPSSIGKAASSGCIRMLNEDVSELYRFVKKGATVTVL